MAPAPVSAESLEFILATEATAKPWSDYGHFSSLFKHVHDELADTDPRKEAVGWEIALHDYHLGEAEKGLQPMFVLEGRVYPPPVEAFPEEGVAYFQQRLAHARHPSVRSRLADFLWLRTKQIGMAEVAVAEYLKAAPQLIDSDRGRSMACEHLARAAYLVLSLRRPTDTLLCAIRALAERFVADQDGHLAHLLSVTKDAIDLDTDLAAWLIDQASALADAKRGGEAPNSLLQRHLLDALLDLGTVRRDQARARAFKLRIAQSFEDEAAGRAGEGGIVQGALLQDAIRTYQEIGDGDAVDRLKPLIHEATQRAEDGLHRVSTQVEFPIEEMRDQVERLLAHGRERSPFAHLPLFALTEGLWPKWSEVAQFNSELNEQAPLQALVSKTVITHDGRPLERPHDADKAREFDEIQRYAELFGLLLRFSGRKAVMLREREAWSFELLMQALATGVLFDEEVLQAVAPGIRSFEEGRHWEALHVLVPQIERVIRKLAKNIGTEVFRYKADTGELHWSSLKTLLEDPRVEEVLGRISPDLARELRCLLIDQRGWNLRDDLSHGILPPHDGDKFSFTCVIILLTLATLVRADAPLPSAAAPSDASGPEEP